jgi:hypothetical protein
MSLTSRVRALEDKFAELDEMPSMEQSMDCLRNGRWTWRDVRVALGDGQIAAFTEVLLVDAIEARNRRERGEPRQQGTAAQHAAEILSYLPNENPPADCATAIERSLVGQVGVPPALAVPRMVQAAMCMLILGTRDGIEVRRSLWEQ